MSDQSLSGSRLLVTGVVTEDSIAYAVASRAQRAGATVVLTTFDRVRDLTIEVAAGLSPVPELLTLDVTDPDHWPALTETLRASYGAIDGALHAVAFAPRDALSGDMTRTPDAVIDIALRTSTTSYARLAGVLADLAPSTGGSLVGLDFDADGGAWPTYNWMGVCKTALQSLNRYLARDLGPRGIRANLVAAGPLHTRAASGIPHFDRLLEAYETTTPLGWDPHDATPVADAVLFLMSPAARAVSGEILHVDGGFHAMATALRTPSN